MLVIGSSGGVTGMIREYALLDNGDLFVSKGLEGEWKFLRKLKHSLVKPLFEEAESLALMSYRFNHPGNMTYYIVYKADKRKNTIKWGETGTEIRPEVKQFYDKLIATF